MRRYELNGFPEELGLMRIMVVENDALVREPVVEGLRQAGFETIEACTGYEAVELLNQHSPDVLVTDISLPGDVTGWEVAERGREIYPSLKVIYASGFPKDDTREIPYSRHLTKPFRVGQIIAAVTEMALESGPANMAGPL